MANRFGRRSYTVKDDGGQPVEGLKAKVTIEIGGRVHTAVELRAPGLIAVVCRPDAPDTFTIEMVESGGRRFTDFRLPPEAGAPTQWQVDAITGDQR
jgi:hypothetical protein